MKSEIIIHIYPRMKTLRIHDVTPEESHAYLGMIRGAGQFFYYDADSDCEIEISACQYIEHWFTVNNDAGRIELDIVIRDGGADV